MRTHLFPLILPCLLLCGCKTKIVTVPEYHVRDSLVVRFERDSVFFRDSVFVDRYTVGDTVFLAKHVTKYAYRDRLRTDTVTVVKRDSVPYVVGREVVEHEYRTRWYDKACRLVAAFALLAMLVWLAWRKMRR